MGNQKERNKMKSKMDKLREAMDAEFYAVKKDMKRCVQAREMGNLAGKIIKSVEVETVYAIKRGEKPEIEYVNKNISEG